jgi:hypothetical protein
MGVRAMTARERGLRAVVRVLAIALVVLGASAGARAQQLTATLEPGASSAGDYRGGTLFCEVGDRVQLVVQITGDGAEDASPPEAPRVDGLKIDVSPAQSTRISSSVNGRVRSMTQTTLYGVNCWPLTEGEFLIPGFEVHARGDRLKTTTNGLRLKVRKGTDLSNVVFVKVTASRQHLYVEQPFTIRVELRFSSYYFRRIMPDPGPVIDLPWMGESHRFTPIGKPAEATRQSFMVAAGQGAVRLPFKVEGSDGDYVVLSYTQDYLAKQPGPIALEPVSFQCEVATKTEQRQNFFFENELVATQTKAVRAESGPLTLEVRPVPTEKRPASYRDAVGKFDFSVQVPSTEVTVGDSLKVKLQLGGTGNLDYLTMPSFGDLNAAGFREFSKRPSQSEGHRDLELELAPQDANVKSVPRIEFSFFDPDQEKFITIERGPFPITVHPHPTGKVLTGLESESAPDVIEIHTIKTEGESVVPRLAAWILHRGWLALVPLVVAVGICSAIGRHRRKLAQDRGWARSRQAMSSFRERLREVDRARARGDQAGAYAALSLALKHYIGDKVDRPGAGLVGDEAATLLKEAGVHDALIERVRAVFSRCELAHYAPAQALDGLEASQAEAVQAVNALEEAVR